MSRRESGRGGRIGQFFDHESAGGILLVAMAGLAVVLKNSGLAWLYDGLLDTPVSVRVGALALEKPLLLWINDGLMAIFFFLVGLEIKREMVEGALASRNQALLPALAALGGMIVPALIYVAFTHGDATALRGWAIPSATDIAFALAVLALLGNRVPPSLKVFLLALAVLDDLGAIVIIALFYTADLSWLAFALAGPCAVALVILNRLSVMRTAPYLLVGLCLWACVLKSGVHATLAGVVTALAIPIRSPDEARPAPLPHLIEALHPWVAFAILPLFAFANAGVSLDGLSLAKLAHPVALGIACGLFIGKQVGVLAATWLAVHLGLAERPAGATWLQVYGVALLAGIGFTMSLFIGSLAFSSPEHATLLRVGVMAGSLVSALAGYVVLRLAAARKPLPARDA